MDEILRAVRGFFAADEALNGQHFHFHAGPDERDRALPLGPKSGEAVDAVDEVDAMIVAQSDDAAGENVRAEPLRDGENADVLADGQIDPNVRVHRGAGRALQHRRSQPDDQEADFFRVEGLQEFTNWM